MTTAADALYSRIPRRYGAKTTQYLRGLLEALATGDEFLSTQVETIRDNLVSITAVGRHLDRRAGLYGVTRGQGAGVLDPEFRKIVPLLGMSPKQLTATLMALVDTIYGPYSTHANATSSAFEPYAILPGMSLRFRVDDGDLSVIFQASDAATLSAATARELATAVSKRTGGRLVGSVVSDARTGKNYLNVRTRTVGTQGFVQCLGGNAQAKLLFPQVRPTQPGPFTWSIARGPGAEMLFTCTIGAPGLKTAGVRAGDLVTIRTDSGFNAHNCGTFPVTNVGPGETFRLLNAEGLIYAATVTAHADDLTFFDPALGNPLLVSRPACVLETSAREATIILPVTSPIVKRTLRGGHHYHRGVTTAGASAEELLPPFSLVYSDMSPSYTELVAITPNTPTNGGGMITLYTVLPALPAGLLLNSVTGIITGTPTVLQAASNFVVTGSNTGGSTDATLSITVAVATSFWTNVTADFITSGPSNSGITKISGGGSFTGGAFSSATIPPGSFGSLEFKLPNIFTPGGGIGSGVAGLTSGASGDYFATMAYGIGINTYTNDVNIFEFGVLVATAALPVLDGTALYKVQVSASVVTFYVNGSLVYTSATPAILPLFAVATDYAVEVTLAEATYVHP